MGETMNNDHVDTCAILNIVTSIALQEASIAHILHAESEKVEFIMSLPNVSFNDILCANQSIKHTLEALLQLEILLQKKLDIINYVM